MDLAITILLDGQEVVLNQLLVVLKLVKEERACVDIFKEVENEVLVEVSYLVLSLAFDEVDVDTAFDELVVEVELKDELFVLKELLWWNGLLFGLLCFGKLGLELFRVEHEDDLFEVL